MRCGKFYDRCKHINTAMKMSPEHADRIKARYALGKMFNPDHDNTSYTDGKCSSMSPPVTDSRNDAGPEATAFDPDRHA